MSRINIDKPRWDQRTYFGRAMHFIHITNPLNILASNSELDRAKDIVTRHRNGEKLNLSEDEIWRAKHLYDSAFHPDTGEKMVMIGRMSACVPANMVIIGGMLAFYKTTREVVFWQWINQSYCAALNYTNRSGDSPVTNKQLGISYVLATGGALATALGLNILVRNAPPIIGRLVPFCAVASANFVNIPVMRYRELYEGITVTDKNGNKIGQSQMAAKYAISQVTLSRIGMVIPEMVIPPFILNHLENKGTLKKFPWINAPLNISLCGVILAITTPLCSALFPQISSIDIGSIEPELREKVAKLKIDDKKLYFNKGL